MILFSPLIFGQNAKIGVTAFGVSQSKPFVLNIFSKQFLFNVLIMLPFGSILKIKKSKLINIVLLGVSLEFVQYILSMIFYLNRVFDFNDILANTLGLAIGYIISSRIDK